MPHPQAAYRASDGISYQRVADELVVLDLKSGKYFGLNKTAAYIFLALVEGSGDAAGYATRFRVSDAEAERDLREIAADLVKRRFIRETG